MIPGALAGLCVFGELESISRAGNSEDILRLRRVLLDFVAQVLDVDIDDPAPGIEFC